MFWSRTLRNSLRRNRSLASRGKSFRFGVERLEDRLAPANVTATVQMGVLFLTAEDGAFDDVIEISPGGVELPGRLYITGLGTGTKINGADNFTTAGIVNSIVCRLKGGKDTLMFNATITGNLTFNGGDGDNLLLFEQNSVVGGTVRYVNGATSANTDELDLIESGVRIGHDLIANYGAGASVTKLGLDGTTIGNGPTIFGKVSITAGSGADTLETQSLTVGQSLVANLGGGANVVSLDALGDDLLDNTGKFTAIGGALKITTGSGADAIFIGSEQHVDVLGSVVLVTGNESSSGDTVFIDDSTFYSNVFIDLGAGDDHVLFETTDTKNGLNLQIVGLLTVLGRGGNDLVAFGQSSGFRVVQTARSPKLDGGSGPADSLLVISLRINGVGVINVSDFSVAPVNFESIGF